MARGKLMDASGTAPIRCEQPQGIPVDGFGACRLSVRPKPPKHRQLGAKWPLRHEEAAHGQACNLYPMSDYQDEIRSLKTDLYMTRDAMVRLMDEPTQEILKSYLELVAPKTSLDLGRRGCRQDLGYLH